MWTEPGLDLDRVQVRPLYTFLLKTASRCNLACDYCYVYFSADQSWRERPRFIGPEVVRQTAKRVAEHVSCHSLDEVQVVFHGGEPLLAGPSRIAEIADLFLDKVRARVNFGVQTNGTLLTEHTVQVLATRDVKVGISIDGSRRMNARRIFRNGHPSYDTVMRGIETVRRVAPHLWAGVLIVLDLEHDPLELYQFLRDLQPPSVDIVLPDQHHVSPPPRPADDRNRDAYGRWMADFFDAWFADQPPFRVRYFEEILKLLMGGTSELETIGAGLIDLIVIEADGQIEPVDTLKSAGRHATNLNLDVFRHSFDEALAHPAIRSRMGGAQTLCATCRGCPEVRVCGGGYLPHRYGLDGTFAHPSVYCHDLLYLIEHVRQQVRPLLLQAQRSSS